MGIFEFNDYRLFLEQRLRNHQKKSHGVKSMLADFLDVNPTLVSQVLSGEKDLTLEQAKKVTDFLGLHKLEVDYFILLVQIERAGNNDLKSYFKEKKETLKKESLKLAKRLNQDKGLSDLERSIFYSSKVYSAIHLYTSVGPYGKNLDDIMKRFRLSKRRAMEIVSFLLSAGLINNNNGNYKMAAKSTHIEKGSPFLINHHTNWRISAIQKIEKITDEEMMYTGNFSLSKEDFLKVREELVQSLQKIIKTVQASPEEEVANLNIDLFWI